MKEAKKRELRRDLEIAVIIEERMRLYWYPIKNLLDSQNKILLLETPEHCGFIRYAEQAEEQMEPQLYGEAYEKKEKGGDWFFCIELCPEYIDYLKTVLKPYL